MTRNCVTRIAILQDDSHSHKRCVPTRPEPRPLIMLLVHTVACRHHLPPSGIYRDNSTGRYLEPQTVLPAYNSLTQPPNSHICEQLVNNLLGQDLRFHHTPQVATARRPRLLATAPLLHTTVPPTCHRRLTGHQRTVLLSFHRYCWSLHQRGHSTFLEDTSPMRSTSESLAIIHNPHNNDDDEV
jgi:hypothetical protein